MKKYITVGIALFLAGIGIMLAALLASDFDFETLSTEKYEEVTHTVEGEFEHIFITTQIHNIALAPSNDGVCRVVGDESENIKIKIECDGESLVIKTEDSRKWYHFIGINLGGADLTLYLPDSIYFSLTAASDTGHINIPEDFSFTRAAAATATGAIVFRAGAESDLDLQSDTGSISASKLDLSKISAETATGKITLENIKAENGVRVESDTGRIELHEIECNSLNVQVSTSAVVLESISVNADIRVTSDTGKVTLTRCISMDMHIETATGDVILDGSDAETITIKTDTGDVEGSLLTAKIFETDTDTGKVNVPKSAEGGRCKIRTATGDIEITVE